MKKSDTIDKLAAALTKAQAEITPVEFDSKNPFFKSKYASLGAVIAMSRPILAKHGLAIVQLPASDPSGRVGIENVIIHESGEWIAGELVLAPEPEKGRSASQTIGALITYFRRYCWSSCLGIYADEDTDGNTGGLGGDDAGGFDGAGPSRKPTPPPQSSAQPKPATPRPDAEAHPTTDDPPIIAELRKKLGPALASFVWFLRHYDSGNGNPVLPLDRTFDQLSPAWAKVFLDKWDETIGKLDAFLIANPMPEGGNVSTQVEVPRDPETAAPDAWRTFPMPWGDKKGIPLAKLDPKYAYGLWANYKVTEEYKGKPKSPESIAADKLFRKMLDDLGLHRGHKA